jgi:hypothetical protein
MMEGNLRQSYFVSPRIDKNKLARAPISLTPVETDGAHFFEQMRESLSERCGIIDNEAFLDCGMLLHEVADKHDKTADGFIKTKHPLLIFALSYQDGLIHALQRVTRMKRTGEYHSTDALRSRVHGYDRRILEFVKKKDFWNAAYARGYKVGLLFLLFRSTDKKFPKPPIFDTPVDFEFKSLASLMKFPSRKIPKAVQAHAKRILGNLPSGADLLPDHTPFL